MGDGTIHKKTKMGGSNKGNKRGKISIEGLQETKKILKLWTF